MGDRRDGRNSHATLEKLILPEVFEPVRRQGRVADRGHDRSVAEIGLDGASVVAVIGELEPAGVPQHVGMHEEREFRSHARPGHHALISGCGQRCATLRDEDVWGRRFAQELAQRAAFPRDIGWTLASPLLALRTCKRPVARSMSSQRSATSSEALRPWR
jgi:hypothetical protein